MRKPEASEAELRKAFYDHYDPLESQIAQLSDAELLAKERTAIKRRHVILMWLVGAEMKRRGLR